MWSSNMAASRKQLGKVCFCPEHKLRLKTSKKVCFAGLKKRIVSARSAHMHCRTGKNKLGSGQFGLLNRNVLERHLLGPRETYVANPISVKSCVSALKNKPAPCVKTWVPSPQNVSCSWERNLSEGKQGVSRLEHVRKWSLLPLRTFVIEKKCGLSVFLPPGIPGLPGSKQTLDEKSTFFHGGDGWILHMNPGVWVLSVWINEAPKLASKFRIWW